MLPDGKLEYIDRTLWFFSKGLLTYVLTGTDKGTIDADIDNLRQTMNSISVVGQYSSSTWQQEITIQLGFTPKAAFIGTKYNTQDYMNVNNNITGFVSAQNVKSNSSTYIMIVNNGILLHDYGGNYTLFNNGWTAYYICFK